MSTCLILVMFCLSRFLLHNVAILPTRRVSGKFLDLFLSGRLERPREVPEFYSIRKFRDVNQSELVTIGLFCDRD
jgi:hypothetical protein